MIKSIMLVFFGVSLHSLIIITPILDSITQNQPRFFPLEIIVVYLCVSFGYSFITSLYSNPHLIISPYLIQFGTAGFIILIVIIRLIISSTDLTVVLELQILTLFLQLMLFVVFGYGITIILRKMFGVQGDEKAFCNETYRIEAEYKLIKNSIFDDEYFIRYKFNKLKEEERITVSKKIHQSGEIRLLILLQPNSKSPDESILSISTCEIRFESMWKTEQAEKVLKSIKRIINGVLLDKFSIKLIPDEQEEIVSAKCDYLLLTSMQSSLSGMAKTQGKLLFAVLGLVMLGIFVTFMPHVSFFPDEKFDLETTKPNIEIVVFTWVTIVTTAIMLFGSQIREKISKHTE